MKKFKTLHITCAVVGIISIAVAMLLLIFGSLKVVKDRKIDYDRLNTHVDGVVVDGNTAKDVKNGDIKVTVTYKYGENEYSLTTDYPDTIKEGDTRKVYLDMSNPSDSALDPARVSFDDLPEWIVNIFKVMCVIATISIILGVVLIIQNILLKAKNKKQDS